MTDYDPANFSEFYGKTFVTGSGSRYTITQDGRISGRPSIEGAEIEYIAGIEEDKAFKMKFRVRQEIVDGNNMSGVKNSIDTMIKEYGQKPREGFYLAVSLTNESAREKNRWGFVTSHIEDIE